MPTDRIHPRPTDVPEMSAELIAARRFAQSWRGYDPTEVQQFLGQVAEQVRALKERCERADAARRDAEQRASHPEIDEAALMAAVGEETAAILRSAKVAASEITAKAQASADAMVSAAEAKASEIVAEAGSLLATKTAEAEAAAAEIRETAAAEAENLRAAAQERSQELEVEAQRKSEEAVQAAQALREKILSDLARRRKVASVQIEQLRAGRERLLDAYLVVRRTLEEVTDELQRADSEARAAAGAAARHHAVDELADPPVEHQEITLPVPGPISGPEGVTTPVEGERTDNMRATVRQEAPVVLAPKAAELAGLPGDNVAGRAIVSRHDSVERVRLLREPPPPPEPSPEAHGANGPGGTVDELDEPEHPAGEESKNGPRPAPQAQHDVHSLFARIRAGRAEATDAARKALGDDDDASEDAVEAMPSAEASLNGSAKAAGAAAAPLRDQGAGSALAELLARREEVTGRLEASLARKLKRALQDEQNSLLDRLRGVKGPATPADLLPSEEEHPDRFADAGRPFLDEAMRAGSEVMASLCGHRVAVPSPGEGTLDDLADELGKAIAGPLRERLEVAMRSSSDEPSEMADVLGSAYREWKTQRVEAVARDQVSAAFARGAYVAAPEGSLLSWVASEAPCPDCEDNALAGEQHKAEPWPTGQLHPPAHPGCTCALVPAG